MKNKISEIKQFLKNKKNKVKLFKNALAVSTTIVVTGCGPTMTTVEPSNKPLAGGPGYNESKTEIYTRPAVTTEEILEEIVTEFKPIIEETNPTTKEEITTEEITTKEEEMTTEEEPTTEKETTTNITTTSVTNSKRPTTTTTTTTSKKPTRTTTTTTGKKTTTTTTTTKKPTTTTTTTTRKPTTTTTTTKPPVIQNQYKIEDIATNILAFDYYAGELRLDLMKGNGKYTNSGNLTYGAKESYIALAMLNDGLISNNILQDIFEYYTTDHFEMGAEFLYEWCQTQNMFGTDVDFSKYTIDKEIGSYLNNLDSAYRKGTTETYLYDKFILGNMSKDCAYNPAVWAISCSYDKNHTYLTTNMVEVAVMEQYIKELNQTVHGKSYTR